MKTSSLPPITVLGGFQTDFARNFAREGKTLADLVRETAQGALLACGAAARDVDVGHVGNFAAELFAGQGHLGGLLIEADPAFAGLPTSRHEAACASGGVAVLAAMADLQAGRYDLGGRASRARAISTSSRRTTVSPSRSTWPSTSVCLVVERA